MSEFSVSLVIPAYNESKRLAYLHQEILAFKKSNFCPFEVILVNDGSRDDTAEKLQLLVNRWKESLIKSQLVTYDNNKGKGGALKEGVKQASHNYILTLDIDMSTSPLQLIEWNEKLKDGFSDDIIYIGSRQDKQSNVSTVWYRKFAGKIFNILIKRLINLRIKDTQCGFKLYPQKIGKKLFQELRETGWAHDIEILMRAEKKGIEIKSLAVNWVHRGDAKISVITDGFKMLQQIISIKNRLSKE